MTETELSQKQQRIGRTRRALCAIRGFVDRHLTTKTVIVLTILLLLASWIYPPWIIGSYRNISHGWFFVFDTTRETAMRVDFGRLFLIDAILAAFGGLLAWAVSQQSAGRRAAVRIIFYTLVVASTSALIWFGVFLIGNIRQEVAKRALTKMYISTDPNAGRAKDIFDEVAEKERFVTADDLKKITLFEVNPVLRPPAWERGFSYWDFTGRVRNDLTRTVEKIAARASFYTADGELIEAKTFWMLGPDWQLMRPLIPNSSVIFHSNVDFVYNLPTSWTYRLDVIEAHYVDSEPWKKDPIVR